MEVSRRDLFKTSAAIAVLGVMSRVSRAESRGETKVNFRMKFARFERSSYIDME